MASQDQSFSSNNPFRRKLGTPTISTENPAATSVANFDGHFDSIPRAPFTTFKSNQSEKYKQEKEDKEEVASIQPKPKKVVKRVRVQSPPPSSPEDAVPVARFPPVSDDEDEDDDDDSNSSDSQDYEEHIGRYKAVSFAARDNDSDSTEHTQTGPPPNPFSKTLHDLEQTEQGQGQGQDANTLAASAAAKGALDVNSFKRLLLTGYANIPGPSSTSASSGGGNTGISTSLQTPLHDGASNTDASSVSRQSIFDAIQDTPRTSHEISEPEDPEERRSILPTSPLSSIPSSSARKKPPPPNSRHGKLIKIELGADADSRISKNSIAPISISTTSLPSIAPPRKSNSYSITPLQSPPLPTDVNKPLPQTPFRPSVEEAVDSPFDREAIGKVPEPFADPQSNPRPPTPPVVTRNRSASNGSTQTRKPAAPPPRRHGRSDSRAPSIHTGNPDDDTPPRSSLDSIRSRTDSLRANTNPGSSVNVPAPPPPRRPNHARQGSSFTSPSQVSFALTPLTGPGSGEIFRSPTGTGFGPTSSGGQIEDSGSLATITTSKDGLPKLSPPPPPPTRQASTRRPPSVRSMDTGNGFGALRRVSKEKEGAIAPPPPPPPPRQRGSSRASVEAPAHTTTTHTDGTRNQSSNAKKEQITSTQPEGDTKQGAEILADLDALQREVDALMGQVGKSGD
ncbi:hypothetical protein F4781DRAFT_395695 [Annulohypoxylon bovei var. microspora]|nr:hypothetical protein F4781DRAFT_395695 [Annulohypoxylon bovei var. microspora]